MNDHDNPLSKKWVASILAQPARADAKKDPAVASQRVGGERFVRLRRAAGIIW
jgi:hypothetical protein